MNEFPRKLFDYEKEWLFTALPKNKLGYKLYRDKIESLFVIGNGRFGGKNFVLGPANSKVDLDVPTSAVFAVSYVFFDSCEVYVVIHEEQYEQIEIDFRLNKGDDFPIGMRPKKYWSYSDWNPGQKAPFDNSYVREVHLIKNKLILAIAPAHKRIWIYEFSSKVNYFVPVTNLFNEIRILKGIKDPQLALNPNSFFTNLDLFSDSEIGQGFLLYNKYLKRIDIDYNIFLK
ncbi:hypothetical protein ABRY23_06660 [Melioribacteraceae bacterium 4301-Me]|uniref:hypothetical protein n=1 Tax=Pyranulibacter aquaticus TaxID=3163344 RepID=UPI003594F495